MTSTIARVLCFYLTISLAQITNVSGHGYLKDPPSRSSLWREFENDPLPDGVNINYNDNELFCGGFAYQWNSQGGKCGVCGDPYDGPHENEAGGKYASGYISRTYTQGQVIDIEVKITADHKGYFEFHLCPHNNPTVPITHDCLDQYPLALEDGNYRYTWVDNTPRIHEIRVQLPTDVTCTQCVVQWKYNTGNSWGCDFDDPTNCANGLGPQEQFYGCADVAITSSGSGPSTTPALTSETTQPSSSTTPEPSTTTTTSQTSTTTTSQISTTTTSQTPTTTTEPSTTTTTSQTPTTTTSQTSTTTTSQTPTTTTSQTPTTSQTQTTTTSQTPTTSTLTSTTTKQQEIICKAIPPFTGPGRDEWCELNCPLGNCPSSHCLCESQPSQKKTLYCVGVSPHNSPAMAAWCERSCALGPCPPSHCSCSNTPIGNQGNNSPETSTLMKVLMSSTTTSGNV